ncbi:MAG TPA: hypothetical protein VGI40_08385 [Pirellulaceae bacterium]
MRRICNLGDGLSQLTHAVADLNLRWTEAKQHWNDSTSHEFEQEYINPIQAQMQLLLTAAQVLAATADKAARELSDPDREE